MAQIKESAAVDSIFAKWEIPNSPGGAVGIVKEGKLIYAKGYGLANLEYGKPNSPTSVFRIGSTSKQFTAACIVLLAEQGKLSYDEKLSKFFPEFPEYADNISVIHLLNHSSGIRDYLTLSYLAGLGVDDFFTDQDVMKWLINQSETNFSPNEEYLYSNSGYWLLGQIVKKVSGRDMADFARENLFRPLEMNNTHFHNDHSQIVKNRASGYAPTKDGYKISMTTLDMIGDGGIFTTVEDLKIWDDNFYKSAVLNANFWKDMTTPLILINGDTLQYAKGIEWGNYKGLKTLSHGGAFVGFRTQMIKFPAQELSIIILANRSDANPTSKAFQIADIMLKDQFEPAKPRGHKTSSLKVADKIVSTSQLEKICANYWNEQSSFSAKIYLKQDTLRYFFSKNWEKKLVPISKTKFKILGVADETILTFSKDDDGRNHMSLKRGEGAPMKFVEFKPVSYTASDLKRFVGTFYSPELNVSYDLKMKAGGLMLYLNGREISAMRPIKVNLFRNQNFGVFKFSKNLVGQIGGFDLTHGRVKNLRFVKK